MNSLKEFKIIQEYPRYYLCINNKGIKECFDKTKYEPNNNGFIIKHKEKNYKGGKGLPSEKVNKSFNPGKMFK